MSFTVAPCFGRTCTSPNASNTRSPSSVVHASIPSTSSAPPPPEARAEWPVHLQPQFPIPHRQRDPPPHHVNDVEDGAHLCQDECRQEQRLPQPPPFHSELDQPL